MREHELVNVHIFDTGLINDTPSGAHVSTNASHSDRYCKSDCTYIMMKQCELQLRQDGANVTQHCKVQVRAASSVVNINVKSS